jgi:hypothetical protein
MQVVTHASSEPQNAKTSQIGHFLQGMESTSNTPHHSRNLRTLGTPQLHMHAPGAMSVSPYASPPKHQSPRGGWGDVGASHGILPHVAKICNRFATVLICKCSFLCNNIPIAMHTRNSTAPSLLWYGLVNSAQQRTAFSNDPTGVLYRVHLKTEAIVRVNYRPILSSERAHYIEKPIIVRQKGGSGRFQTGAWHQDTLADRPSVAN